MSAEQIYSTLRDKLKTLEYFPGDPITISDICSALRVSHIPVREALVRLGEEGWIEHVRGRGFFVRHVDEKLGREALDCVELAVDRAVEQMYHHDALNSSNLAVQRGLRVLHDAVGRRGETRALEHALVEVLSWLDNRFLAAAARHAFDQICFAICVPSLRGLIKRGFLFVVRFLEALAAGQVRAARRLAHFAFRRLRNDVGEMIHLALRSADDGSNELYSGT